MQTLRAYAGGPCRPNWRRSTRDQNPSPDCSACAPELAKQLLRPDTQVPVRTKATSVLKPCCINQACAAKATSGCRSGLAVLKPTISFNAREGRPARPAHAQIRPKAHTNTVSPLQVTRTPGGHPQRSAGDPEFIFLFCFRVHFSFFFFSSVQVTPRACARVRWVLWFEMDWEQGNTRRDGQLQRLQRLQPRCTPLEPYVLHRSNTAAAHASEQLLGKSAPGAHQPTM